MAQSEEKTDDRNRVDSLQIPMVKLALNDASKSLSNSPKSNASSPISEPKSYSDKVIHSLSVALRFLFDENSPLDNISLQSNDRFHSFNDNFLKQPQSVNKIKRKIKQLCQMSNKDTEQIKNMHKFWDKWQSYDEKEDDDDYFEESDDEDELTPNAGQILPQVSTAHSKFGKLEQDYMKGDYLDFIHNYKTYTKKYQIIDSKVKEQIEENKNEESKQPEETFTTNVPTQLTSQKTADPDNIKRIIELKNVVTSQQMDEWLAQWKDLNEANSAKCMNFFKNYKWKSDVTFKLPMNEWYVLCIQFTLFALIIRCIYVQRTWKQVVSYIEKEDRLKHFSSIFYEYQIDGQELCALTFRSVEFLIEKALISAHNIFENDFYKFKRMKKQINKEWQLSNEIAELLQYINKGRILSHVISRYYLNWEILKHKKEKKGKNNEEIAKTERAKLIFDIIKLLKPPNSEGPKKFWKMDAYFLAKIDNFLAVLTANTNIQKIFRKHHKTFLNEVPEDNAKEISGDYYEENLRNSFSPVVRPMSARSRMKRAATRKRIEKVGPEWRMKSNDPGNLTVNGGMDINDIDLVGAGGDSVTREVSILRPGNLFLNDFVPHARKREKRYDCLDKIADKMCHKDSKQNQYIHNIPRVYLKALCMLIFATIFGSLFATLWFYDSSIRATDQAMKKTVESIGEREINIVNYGLFAPQSLQSTGIGEIKIQSDLLDEQGIAPNSPYRDSYVENGDLDYLMAEWSYAPNTKHISSFYLYNNNTNKLIGAHRVTDNDTMVIAVYNGSCWYEYIYDHEVRKRDFDQLIEESTDCSYAPRSRPWHTEIMEVGGVENSIWTKPYWFQEEVFGVTLSTMFEHQGSVWILFNEMTIDSISSFYDRSGRLKFPKNTAVLLVMPSLDVLFSNVADGNGGYQIDLHSVHSINGDCHGTECEANNDMIVSSMKYLRDNQVTIDRELVAAEGAYKEYQVKPYWVNIFHFDALYMDTLLFGNDAQDGYIVIAFSEEHWDQIELAYVVSWVIAGLMLFFGSVLICYNVKFHRANYFERQASITRQRTEDEALPKPDGTAKDTKFKIGINLVSPKRQTSAIAEESEQSDDNSEESERKSGSEEEDEVKQNQEIKPVASKLLSSALSSEQSKSNRSLTGSSAAPLMDRETTIELSGLPKSKTSIRSNPSDSRNMSLDRKKSFVQEYIFEPRWCQLSQKALVFVLFVFMCFTFGSLLFLWVWALGNSIDVLIEEVMAPQEWNVVRDKVYQLMESAESIKQIIDNRLNDDGIDSVLAFEESEFDQIFTNAMTSYVNKDNKYAQYFIYVGKPDGTFRGSSALDPNQTQQLVDARDVSTNFTRITFYADEDNVYRDWNKSIHAQTYTYDPRCRPWYINAVKKRFSGTLKDAFPGDTWAEFSADDVDSLSRQTLACKDAVEEYKALFNVSDNATIPYDDSFSINNDGDTSMYLVWNSYVFTSLNAIGLTASGVIKKRDSDELLGVVGIDFTLDALSSILNQSIGSKPVEKNWHSWIFEASKEFPDIVASSDFNTLTSTESIDGCLQLEGEAEQIPFSARNHPELFVRILSNEVLDHYNLNEVDFVTNATEPFVLEAPIDYPISQGGIIRYYPEDSGLDWVVMKLVDVNDITAISGDALKITGIILAMILCVSCICFKEITIQFSNGYNEDELENLNEEEEEQEQGEQDYLKDLFKMQTLIDGAAKRLWAEKMGRDGDSLITTECAQDFLADRANEHITGENDRNQIFLSCVLEYMSGAHNWQNKFLTFMFSNYYAVPAQMVIVAHLLITFWEPPNESDLRKHGLSPDLIIANTVCIFLEFIFCVLCNTLYRHCIFSIKREHLIKIYELYFGINNKYTKKLSDESKSVRYLILWGPHCARYLLRIFFCLAILFDFVQRIAFGAGFFSYRVPALPFLFVVENRHVWRFLWEFMDAMRYTADVILSYLAFILMFAICAMSLFGSTDLETKELTVDSFDSFTRSLITAFVYISTSENYDSVVAETFFGREFGEIPILVVISAVSLCLIFVVMGLFVFVPMIIHRFEESFKKHAILKNETARYRKSEALIAAFIMLDMDGSMDIDREEFDQLVSHSILVNKNKMFDWVNSDGNDIIDLNEFVFNLSKQEFRSKMLYHGEQKQNKFQAWMECNVYRRYRSRLMIFLIFVLPVFGIALLRGLTDINDQIIDLLLNIFFFANAADIALRWASFGFWRYWDLERYPNPPYTNAAINKYNSKRRIPDVAMDNVQVIRLSASQKKWVVNNLRDTRPHSALSKAMLTICHRLEASVFIIAMILYIVSSLPFFFFDATNVTVRGYQRHIWELAIFIRFFTLLQSTQQLLYVIFTVFPQFASLTTFLLLIIYGWARLGCQLFGDGNREIITEEVYPESANITTDFSTLAYAMLSLIQLMIGEGWHEIMYYNVMSTSLRFSLYFIVYIWAVTIIIANVFVGLFLADIDALKSKQEDEDTLSQYIKRSGRFKNYAKDKLKELQSELQTIDEQRERKMKQIATFKRLMQTNELIKNKSVANQSMFEIAASSSS